MEKINIGELLKNCPKGMELDCTMYEDVYFDYVDELNIIHCYVQYETHKASVTFNLHGAYNSAIKSKCVIYPKGKTTWEGFQRPFKDGDIIYVCDEYSDATFTYVAILKQIEKGGKIISHCFYNNEDDYFNTNDFLYDVNNTRFATEEEKQKLFNAIKANGYKWNPETKTLEKLIEPKFKVGDRVKEKKAPHISGIITDISDDTYKIEYKSGGLSFFSIEFQDGLELVPNKFDITTLKPFDKVLVRDTNKGKWKPSFWGFYDIDTTSNYPYVCVGCAFYQCIPYEGNEHLLGTTNECDSYFKTWE